MPIDAIALAQSSPDASTFASSLLGALQRTVGYEVAFFAGPELTVVGLDRARLERNVTRYEREAMALKNAALRARGVAIDTEVLGEARRRCAYFRDFAEPIGGKHTLMAYLTLRGSIVGGVMLGRTGAMFSANDVAHIEASLPALAVAYGTYGSTAPLHALTAREREVLRFLCLGYTNREIGLACGTSPNTVRNQLVSIFGKLGASTRAEVVAIAGTSVPWREPALPRTAVG